jgi:hypothetical protein
MINSPFVDHSEIAAEAELVFYMTSAPLLHWKSC